MANMYDRLCGTSDFDTDGGGIGADQISDYVQLYSTGTATAEQIKTAFSFTEEQGADLDALLATMPTVIETVPDVLARLQWALRIGAVLDLVACGAAYPSPEAIKAALGIS